MLCVLHTMSGIATVTANHSARVAKRTSKSRLTMQTGTASATMRTTMNKNRSA
jgi:hypothetical protein